MRQNKVFFGGPNSQRKNQGLTRIFALWSLLSAREKAFASDRPAVFPKLSGLPSNAGRERIKGLQSSDV
jgi:hypothetical protein